MKLRSIICVSAMAAVASASVLTSGNTFARLPVTGNTYENALIAIPFAGCGETNAEIYVTNLVMTANLKAGDKLLYKDGSTYYAWRLTTDGGPWQQMATSTDFGKTEVTPSAEQTTLPCGKGCWLVRSGVASRDDSTIYLFGQVNVGSLTTTVPASSDGTIICRPYETGAIDLSSWKPTGVAAGDTVSVPDSDPANLTGKKTYTYKDGNWTVQTSETKTNKRGIVTTTVSYTPVSSGTTIPAGVAFMYGRYGNTDLTITWNK
jgi:hypothetical protein